ncbi:MAG: low temperature requirement protein A [Clostridia bacterium]|nr:low temperature requirement protein A [Clostridia bacterium]
MNEQATFKKVEYLELIYDLIFVYVIGRNSSLLQHVQNGFVPLGTFYAYALCSLAAIQIWSFSTFYINMCGRNGLRDHVFLFLNMYLLYYIGEGTRLHWERFQNQYHAAWALILINLGIQYLIELRNRSEHERPTLIRMMVILFGEALIVLVAIPVYNRTGAMLAPVAILFGIVTTLLLGDARKAVLVDFPHLAERAMLYVVFTFGEMIIAIAAYFEGELTGRSVYFTAACFLIVVGLFLSYEIFYDRILDRERRTSGTRYMLVHVFMIFALNLITAALGFMRDERVRLLPKIVLLTGAFLLYYGCLFSAIRYARPCCKPRMGFKLPVLLGSAAFAVLMLLLRENMTANIALTVVYVFAVFGMVYKLSKA